MTITDIANQRLHAQYLLQGAASPVDVVRSLGAVQSQDFTGAKWALGQRCVGITDGAVTKLFDEGKILRTHMLRPTWHFVAAEDIRWIQELTAPRVHAFNKYYYKKLGLDEAIFQKSNAALEKSLKGGKELTRLQLQEVFRKAGIDASGLKLTYLIMYAELEALVCSGRMQGKQHTIALLRERAPQAKSLPRDKSLAELTKRFFSGHGPATLQDFAWWSSLTLADIQRGIELAGLTSQEVAGKTFYFAGQTETTIPSPVAHLLPNYDEYVIAFKERRPFAQAKLDKTPSYAELSYHLVMMDGQLVGGWKRAATAKFFTVQLDLFKRLTPGEQTALEAAAKRLESFVGLPVKTEQ